jgi:hypothetical protein
MHTCQSTDVPDALSRVRTHARLKLDEGLFGVPIARLLIDVDVTATATAAAAIVHIIQAPTMLTLVCAQQLWEEGR